MSKIQRYNAPTIQRSNGHRYKSRINIQNRSVKMLEEASCYGFILVCEELPLDRWIVGPLGVDPGELLFPNRRIHHERPDRVPGRFFFSSRRRHTRCLSDWSSDVCSSD